MISGATQADVALLVVDATRGEFETGFEQGGQTREHAILVRSLGVSQLGVVVNKLDTVGWSQQRFDEILAKLRPFLAQCGYKAADVTYVPCSGLTGENLVRAAGEPELTAWYSGPTLAKVIGECRGCMVCLEQNITPRYIRIPQTRSKCRRATSISPSA